MPIADDIAAVVRLVRHHHDNCVTTHSLQAPADRPTKAGGSGIPQRHERRNTGADFFENGPGAIPAVVVDNNDFVRNIVQPQLDEQVLDGRGDAAFLIARGNNDR